MKKHLNTLYVTTQGAYLKKEGESVLVQIERVTKLRIPVHTLAGIVCFGRVACSPWLLYLCAERDIGVSFLSETGRFLARVQGPTSGNVLLRRQQYRLADDLNASAGIARCFLVGKLVNSRLVLQRAAREREDPVIRERLSTATEKLESKIKRLKDANALDTIRGIEGEAARGYFEVFDDLIAVQKDAFLFRGRNRRPPLDNINALLSFLYTLLAHDVRSALESVGLDPAVGFLHRDRPGRPSLALDLMEEFRPFLADRVALSLINRLQISKEGFQKTESGAVRMDDATRKTLLTTYQKRKQEEIQHAFLGERVTVGLLVHVQARLLARYIRGELDAYPPFVWR